MSNLIHQGNSALVVDTDPETLTVFETVLSEFGFEMQVINDPEEAIRLLSSDDFHIGVIELSMTHVPAIEFLTRIYDEVPHLPIIGLSRKLESRRRFFSGMIAAFLQKPFTDADVRSTLNAVLANPDKRFQQESTILNPLELKEQNQQLKLLVEIAITLGEEAEFDRLLPLVVEMTCASLNVERITVFFVDKEKNELWSRAGSGLDATEIRVPITAGIAGRVARTGQTVLTNDPYTHDDFNPEFDRKLGFKTRSILCIPVKNANGNIIGILQALNKNSEKGFDGTDEKLLYGIASMAAVRLENSLLVEELEQQKKLSMLGTLAGGVSHEIKNLLAPLSFVELIAAKYPDDEQVRRYTSMINDARDHAINLLEEVRDIAKPTKHYEVEAQSLTDVVREVKLFLSVDSLVKHVDVRLDLAEDLPDLPLNRRKMKQVLINLIRNGCQALPDADSGHIDIRVFSENGDVLLQVADTGKGIPPQQISKIWQPFFSTKGDAGTGLGLDICRKIIEGHDATIDCESEVGVGTTFTIRFPESCYENLSDPDETRGVEVELLEIIDDDDTQVIDIGEQD